jgi:hypothetical protein
VLKQSKDGLMVDIQVEMAGDRESITEEMSLDE